MANPDEETRREVDAAIAARRELGPDFEEHVAAGLLDRVNQLAKTQSGEQRREVELVKAEAKAEKDSRHQRFVLGIVSVGAGIPITAISGALVDPSLAGVLISWAGIVGVNVAAAVRRPPRG